MPTTLKLQSRHDDKFATIALEGIRAVIAANDREQMWSLFANLKSGQPHDCEWLQMVVNWTAEGGMPLTVMAKWLKLARKVGALTEKSTEVTLTLTECDLIWARMTDERFKLKSLSPSFAEFVLDFCEVTGHHFATVKDDPEDN